MPRRRSSARLGWRIGGDRARGGRAALALHDDRHRRAGAAARAAGDARRARGGCSPGRPPRASRSRRSGSARTCSSHDDGRRRARPAARAASWPQARVEGEMLVAGGGATNAVCLHRARDAGLGGFEFASAIPGTAGGGVRMNAGAYGSDWRAVLARRARRRGRRARATVDRRRARPGRTATRGSRPARSSRRCASGSPRGRSRRSRPRSAELLAQRKATQPTTKRTFGSVFKNPRGEPGAGRADRGVRAEGPPDRRRARSPSGTRTSSRTPAARPRADALALMAEARRRVHERFGVALEHEVRFLGPLELPPL